MKNEDVAEVDEEDYYCERLGLMIVMEYGKKGGNLLL